MTQKVDKAWALDNEQQIEGKGCPGKPRKHPPKPTFNKANQSIDWAGWTWNPVTGCEHGCEYCYARDIANRFYKEKFKPTLRQDRLEAPKNTKVPKSEDICDRTVFAVSMGDLFGDWVDHAWIEQVLQAVKENPQWNFLFLTKNPKRYNELRLEFPEKCWLGATADTQERADAAVEVFGNMEGCKAPVLFLSLEPLREKVNLHGKLEKVDWLIIGGQSKSTKAPAMQPDWEWVKDILWAADEQGVPIHFKSNLTVRPQEYPKGREGNQPETQKGSQGTPPRN